MNVRLQKFLADAGVASRRASERIITEGRVWVNGQAARELGTKVDPTHDRVTVDGIAVRAKRKLYVALNKPPGYICSRADPLKRKGVGDLVPKEWGNLYTVGRLDFQSEGLIFLTNDGDFALHLTHPRYGVAKIYLAEVEGRLPAELVPRLLQGVVHEGDLLKPTRVRVAHSSNSRTLVELELREGKNREVRRLFEAHGLKVLRLQRTQIGQIKLGELPRGKWRVLTKPEIHSLLAPQGPLETPVGAFPRVDRAQD